MIAFGAGGPTMDATADTTPAFSLVDSAPESAVVDEEIVDSGN